MKISVVTPFFNTGPYIIDCIESVLAQSHEDVEHVLIDNGSTDDTALIVKAYKEKYPDRISYYEFDSNIGIFACRLLAYEVAQGYAVIPLDSDDMLRADACALLHDSYERFDADIVCFQTTHHENYSRPIIDAYMLAGPYQRAVQNIDLDLFRNVVLGGSKGTRMSVRRSLFDEIHFDWSTFFGISAHEDYLIPILLADERPKVMYIPETLYFWRSNCASSSNKYEYAIEAYDNTILYFPYILSIASRWDEQRGGIYFTTTFWSTVCTTIKQRILHACELTASYDKAHYELEVMRDEPLVKMAKGQYARSLLMRSDNQRWAQETVLLLDLFYRKADHLIYHYARMRYKIRRLLHRVHY